MGIAAVVTFGLGVVLVVWGNVVSSINHHNHQYHFDKWEHGGDDAGDGMCAAGALFWLLAVGFACGAAGGG